MCLKRQPETALKKEIRRPCLQIWWCNNWRPLGHCCFEFYVSTVVVIAPVPLRILDPALPAALSSQSASLKLHCALFPVHGLAPAWAMDAPADHPGSHVCPDAADLIQKSHCSLFLCIPLGRDELSIKFWSSIMQRHGWPILPHSWPGQAGVSNRAASLSVDWSRLLPTARAPP